MSKLAFDLDHFCLAESDDEPPVLPIRLPGRRPFRVHPSEAYQARVFLMRHRDRWWLLHPQVKAKLDPDHYAHKIWRSTLVLACDDQFDGFIVPITQAYGDWFDSMTQACSKARRHWISVSKDSAQGCFVSTRVSPPSIELEWPQTPFADLIANAFGPRIIETMRQFQRSQSRPALVEEG